MRSLIARAPVILLMMTTLNVMKGCGHTSYNTVVPERLEEYYQEFKTECSKSWRAKACKNRLPLLKEIKLEDIDDPNVIGRATWHPFPDAFYEISIDPRGPDLKATLFHELGHVIGQVHEQNSCIMSPIYQPPSMHGGWDQCKRQFFYIQGNK